MTTSRPVIPADVYRLVGPRQIHVEREEIDPAALGTGEIVCSTLFSAISPGTELAAFNGLPPLRPTAKPYPRLLGYMNVARVELAGEAAVGAFPPGALIYTHAAHRSAYRTDTNAVLASVPDGLAARKAAPAYLYRLAWNALRRGGMRPGMTVAVLGVGAIGLAAAQLVRHLGGSCVAVSGFAEALTQAGRAGAQPLERIEARRRFLDRSERDAGIADITISTAGSWDDWQLALALTRFNGVVAVLGFPGRGEAPPAENPLASRFFYDRQITIAAAGFASDNAHDGYEEPDRLKSDMAAILGWIENGTLDSTLLVDRAADAREFPEVCREMSDNRSGPGTVVLDWADFRR